VAVRVCRIWQRLKAFCLTGLMTISMRLLTFGLRRMIRRMIFFILNLTLTAQWLLIILRRHSRHYGIRWLLVSLGRICGGLCGSIIWSILVSCRMNWSYTLTQRAFLAGRVRLSFLTARVLLMVGVIRLTLCG